MDDGGERAWHYWAKTGPGLTFHPVPAHSLDVAAVGVVWLDLHPDAARAWAEALGMTPEALRRFLAWWLGVHDIGKFSDRFQAIDPGLFGHLWPGVQPRAYRPRHTTAGSLFMRARLIPERAQRHAAAGHPWTAAGWGAVLQAIEPSFTGHHGEPPEALDIHDFADVWRTADTGAAREWTEALDALFEAEPWWDGSLSARDIVRRVKAASWHLAGFAVLCDWIGSNTTWFKIGAAESDAQEYWTQQALPAARDALAAIALAPVKASAPQQTKEMFGFPPSPLQRELEAWTPAEGPNLLIIEDVTGSGKTEASLLAIHRIMATGLADGFYFALPTQATANAIHDRLRDAAMGLFASPQDVSMVLAHSGRLALDRFRADVHAALTRTEAGEKDDGRLACRDWFMDSRKRAFVAHAGVGTIDQALLGVLPTRHQSLRLFGLTSRVLVVDEVHAYDEHALQLLETLIRFHTRAGGSTILLSATMPRRLRDRIVQAFEEERGEKSGEIRLASRSFPLLTHAGAGTPSEREIEAAPHSHRKVDVGFVEDVADARRIVLDAAAEGACVCWIRNTVAEATEAWETLAAEGNDALLFHARFTESDRRDKENTVLTLAGKQSTPEGRSGLIVVATQVVEQSLDLDFDALVTDLAPIELLIQRAGRLHRHPERRRPVGLGQRPILHVFAPRWTETPLREWVRQWSPGTNAVYPDAGRLWLTHEILRARGGIRLPEEARTLVEHVYDEDAIHRIPDALLPQTEATMGEHGAQRSHAYLASLDLAAGYRLKDGKWERPELVATRSGEPSTDLYLATSIGGTIQPLAAPTDGWDGARVRIRTSDAARAGLFEARFDPPATGPRSGRVIVLEPDGEGCAVRTHTTADARSVRLAYSPDRGFAILEESS